MFEAMKDAAKPDKVLQSAAGVPVAIDCCCDAQCGVAPHYFANVALTEAVRFKG
ncbi:MAG: hypothetical protein K2X41_04355 [Hyphomicrobium sp.]|nr:hypothetical protein [Hyphomicrobium sp.]